MAMRILKPLVRWGGYYPSKKYTPLVYPGGYTTMDAAIGPLDPLNTFSGDIVRFTTKRGLPMQSLKVNMSPVQDLHGYDSPWPAGGGANKWNEEWETGWIGWAGQDASSDNQIRSKGFIPVVAGETYRIVSSINIQVFYYDANKDFVSYHESSLPSQSTFTIPSGCAYIRFYTYYSTYGGTYKNDIAINYPSTVTTYSPYSNICPISGWTGLNLTRDGTNIWDEITYPLSDGYISGGNGGIVYTDTFKCTYDFVPIAGLAGASLTLNKRPGGFLPGIAFYSSTIAETGLISTVRNNGATANTPWTFTVPSNAKFMRFTVASDATDVQIELGTTASTYEEFNGETVSVTWQDSAGTVYGGTDEIVSGALVRKMAIVDMETLNWNYEPNSGRFYTRGLEGVAKGAISSEKANAICSVLKTDTANNTFAHVNENAFAISPQGYVYVYAPMYPDAATFKTTMTGEQLCYELATPIETAITPTPITALKGYNNVWSNAGPVEVVAYGTPIEEPDVEPLGALGLLLGGAYRNDHTPDDVSDEEALDILLGGADR